MASWNTSTGEEDQPPRTASYPYITTSSPHYQPPVAPSNHVPTTGFAATLQNGYVPVQGNHHISTAVYANSAAYSANIGHAGIEQPVPGSLAALEQMYAQQQQASQSPDMSMLSAPTFKVQQPQSYLNQNVDDGFNNMATPVGFPVLTTSNKNLDYAPMFPLVDQSMLAAGPSSAYSTPPTFYDDSEGAWSFDSSGQEIQSSGSSTRAQPIRTNSPQVTSTTTSETTYDCPVEGCNKTFNRSYNYRAHMETHSANRVYPFDCPIENCDKRFRRKTDLQRHHLSVHEKLRDHQCEFCGRYFSRKDTLRRYEFRVMR